MGLVYTAFVPNYLCVPAFGPSSQKQAETTAAAQQQGGAWGWIRSLQHSAQNMVSGRSDDAVEDAEYIKVWGKCEEVGARWVNGVGRLTVKVFLTCHLFVTCL